MDVGRAITEAMRDQRRRDIFRMWQELVGEARHALSAYWWWGWDISGPGGLGRPGREL